ncbi:MAG TPA: hypothetical protein VFT26_12910, partial [Pyrinomonadaceae bacterium]|nr:hypothetical protein [Pyrinomonadaceae bacterium]
MAKHGNLRNYLEYAPVKLVLSALGLLPPRAAYRIGESMGKIAYRLGGDLRRTGAINLRLAFPEKTDEERAALLRECFDSLGRELGLFSQMASRSREELKQLIEPQGWENLEKARAERGDRLIYVTAHLGAWEMTSFGISLLGYPFTFLVRRLDNPKVEQLVDEVRKKFGNQTIDKLSAARSMVKLLRNGEQALGLLPDLNTLDDEAIFVDFFGVPAATTFVIAKLAVRTNTPLVPFFAPWSEEKEKYLLIAEPPIMPECTGDEEADVRRVTIEITRRL